MDKELKTLLLKTLERQNRRIRELEKDVDYLSGVVVELLNKGEKK